MAEIFQKKNRLNGRKWHYGRLRAAASLMRCKSNRPFFFLFTSFYFLCEKDSGRHMGPIVMKEWSANVTLISWDQIMNRWMLNSLGHPPNQILPTHMHLIFCNIQIAANLKYISFSFLFIKLIFSL